MTRTLLGLAVLALVFAVAVGGRTLTQAPPPPVTPQELTDALSRINQYAQVADTSFSISQTPNYDSIVQSVQGPAATIVQASYTLTSPDYTPDKQAETDALRAFGQQIGSQFLAPAGQRLYEAYRSVTEAIFGSFN